jgi:hypothetical protein
MAEQPQAGQFLLYRADDGRTRLECRFERGSLWLSQAGMVELFQTSKQNIAKHLTAIFSDGELQRIAEHDTWRRQHDDLPSPAERDMTQALEQAVKALPKPKGKKTS